MQAARQASKDIHKPFAYYFYAPLLVKSVCGYDSIILTRGTFGVFAQTRMTPHETHVCVLILYSSPPPFSPSPLLELYPRRLLCPPPPFGVLSHK